MDATDFAMPSPKRQRTESPPEPPTKHLPSPALQPIKIDVEDATLRIEAQQNEKRETNEPVTIESDNNDMLDTLMQHVEAEAAPNFAHVQNEKSLEEQDTSTFLSHQNSDSAELQSQTLADKAEDSQIVIQEESNSADTPQVTTSLQNTLVTEQLTNQSIQATSLEDCTLQVDFIPPTETIEPTGHEEGEGEGEAEWEVDSSPYESSTDTDSSDSSSDDSDDNDEDEDGDYAMLDPEEAARILMQGDAGSDDEGEKSKTKGEGAGLRTANEQLEDVPPIPDVTIDENMKIEELGAVEAVVENNILIRGKVSGEYQVLEAGSLLCLQNRSVVGVVAETLGRVEQPLYTIRFRHEQEIKDRELSEMGTVVYYVPQHSRFVFTVPLKGLKGSDASNFHDEEVGDEEIEFSDDEAEAEHKRQMKLKRSGRLGEAGRGRGGASRGGRGGQRGGAGYKPSPLSSDINGHAYGNGSLEMNYDDDVEEGEEGYTPLVRPVNLNTQLQSSESSTPSHMPPPPYSDRGRGQRGHNHRGNRDRGGRGGGGRGNFRNNRQNNNSNHFQNQQNNPTTLSQYSNPFSQNFSPPLPQYPVFSHQSPPPPPHMFSSQQQQTPPLAPSLTPQNPSYPLSAVTSPMSPLPKSQFSFNTNTSPQFPNQPFSSHSPNLGQQQQQWGYNTNNNAHYHQYQQPPPPQQQQHQRHQQQMPGGFTSTFSNPAMMQFAQQFHHNHQHAQYGVSQQQGGNGSGGSGAGAGAVAGGWQVNQAAAAEVQRQLEEMRKAQQQQQQQ